MIRIYIFGLIYATMITSTTLAVCGVSIAIGKICRKETLEDIQTSIFLACASLIIAGVINIGCFMIISKF